MTKIQLIRADTTLMKSNRRKMKPYANIMNNPHIETQIPNNTATTEIHPANKNSKGTIPSGLKKNNENIFSLVTCGNTNPKQSPNVCNKQTHPKGFQETSIPSTTGGTPPIQHKSWQ